MSAVSIEKIFLVVSQTHLITAPVILHLLGEKTVHDEFLHALLDVFKLLVRHIPPEFAHLHLSCNELYELRRKDVIWVSWLAKFKCKQKSPA